MRILGAVLAAVLLLSGCVSRESGVPAAADKPITTTMSSAAEPTPGGGRPENIDMATLDVCDLLSKLPLQQFDVAGDRPPVGGDSSIFPGSKDCYTNNIDNNLGLTLVAVTTEGAEDYSVSSTRGTNTQVFTDEAAPGYELFVLQLEDPSGCLGAVDVNDGQMLFINYGMSRPGEAPVVPQERLCTLVQRIADAALTTLIG